MALTRVSRHIIDDPFNPTAVSATDVTTTNINASGIGTVGTLRVTGDLTVEGTTTTLDSILTEVDRLEVNANSTVAAGIITQTGSGDILNLYDGSNKEFSVENGGTVKVSQSMAFQQSDRTTTAGLLGRGSLLIAGTQQTDFAIRSAPHNSNLILGVGVTERLRITSDGRIGIGQNAPATTLEIKSDANAQTTATIPTLRITNDDGSASSNDITGSVEFFTEDTSDPNHISGFMRNLSETNAGVNYSLIFGTKSNSVDDATERLRITSDGTVGINNTSPNTSYKLDVAGAGIFTTDSNLESNDFNIGQLTVKNNQAAKGAFIDFRADSNNGISGVIAKIGGFNTFNGTGYDGALTFSTRKSAGNTMNERLRITKDGYIGIGTDNPDTLLNLFGTGANTTLKVHNNSASVGTYSRLQLITGGPGSSARSEIRSLRLDTTSAATRLAFFTTLAGDTSPTERLTITSTGNVGIGSDTPRYALDVNNSNILVSGSSAGTLILEDRGVGDSSRPFTLLASDGGDFKITNANRNASKVTTSSVERFRITGFGTCRLPDDGKLTFGTDDDLQIFHNGSYSYIKDAGTGALVINTDGLYIKNASDTEYLANFVQDSAVTLYFNNSKKFETLSNGVKITGALQVTQEYPTIRPTLDLNFAATKTLDRRITFTRDSVGTYTDENGLVKYASNNTPRFDHNFGTGESLGLLIEESRTNLLSYSTSFNLWSSVSLMSVSVNNQTAPDGTQTAAKFIFPTNPATTPFCTQIYTFSAAAHTFSVFAKYNGIQYLWLNIWDGAVSRRAIFDIQNGTLGSTENSPSGQTITAYGNGWYRCTISATTSANSGDVSIRFANSSSDFASDTITGNGSDGQYIWGAQLEQGAFATSYISTSGSTATRAADNAKITGTNFTDFYNQSEGTFSVTAKPNEPNNGSNYYFIFEAANSSNYSNAVSIGKDNGNTYRLRPMKHSNLSDTSVAYTTNLVNIAIAGSGSGDGVAVVNGTVSATSTGSPSGTQDHNVLHIGNRYPGTSGGHYNGTIKLLKYYNKRLPNAQLQGLTQQ